MTDRPESFVKRREEPDRRRSRRYGIYYAKRVVGDDYFMDHTGAIQVVRPDGTYASSLLATAEAWEIAKRMRQLLAAHQANDASPKIARWTTRN